MHSTAVAPYVTGLGGLGLDICWQLGVSSFISHRSIMVGVNEVEDVNRRGEIRLNKGSIKGLVYETGLYSVGYCAFFGLHL